MNKSIQIFPTIPDIADYLGNLIVDLSKKKKEYELFSIALSGGSTPRAIFEILAEKYKDKINWSRILVFWGDERCVPPTNAESNFRMADEFLLSRVQIPKINIFRIFGENNLKREVKRYSEMLTRLLPKIKGIPQIDLMLLGLGDDGHTASILPQNIDLFGSSDLFVVSQHPVSQQNRISATGKLINHSKMIAFVVTGDKKSEKVAQIIEQTQKYLHLPASLVQPENGELVWILDEAAASKLSKQVRE